MAVLKARSLRKRSTCSFAHRDDEVARFRTFGPFRCQGDGAVAAAGGRCQPGASSEPCSVSPEQHVACFWTCRQGQFLLGWSVSRGSRAVRTQSLSLAPWSEAPHLSTRDGSLGCAVEGFWGPP